VTAAQEWIEIGERVREAREAAGMTQGRLAELVGLERTALVRVEKGERHLNAMELFRLADALGLPPTYLVASVPAAIVSRRQALRAEPVETDRARFQLDVALEQHARDTEWLVGYGVLQPPTDLPPPLEDPRALAGAARRLLDQPRGPLGPMARAAERLGVYLRVVDLHAEGACVLLGTYSAAVIGAAPDPGRRRWTAAHEIGHHLLQDEYTAEVEGVSATREDREQVVDAFAGEFLLPCDDLTARLTGADTTELRGRLVAIAGEYRLSWSAVVNRARRCGLIPADVARRLRADTPVRGDFIAVLGEEPAPDLATGTCGPQWRQAVIRAHAEGLITRARAAELLGDGFSPDDLPDDIS
jgi:transcriptional regulator with XRE-family HTH domain